ncbi:uncharacterized protein N7483_005128 [Penicillium malachiteum]|uniref:uncharacterized protein n=1 Tax=Penicillium malachiteum TaxID=1324776 RepID=UPI002548B97F|nr:uncharacterized protein N7483_005128 [Penicillium malachiteum]KAJ5730620.1 hypothetical protein N7483_005128 [Penicillium malachiteum]
MPYICLLDSCPLSNSLFRSKKDWLNHMKNEHTAQSWTCLDSTHDTKLSFQTQDEFEQHMRDEHEGQFEEADLEDLIEVCLESRTTTVKFNDCPFCPDSMNTIPGDWTQHIAQHLLAFSRMSFDGYMEGEDKASDFSQSIDSSDVSGAQVLSKTIADELRAMPLDTDKVHDYDLAFGPSENRSRLETESEIEEAALLMSLLGSNEYDAARDLIEEKDEHWDTSIFPDNSSIIRTILEDPGAQLAQERATELRETLLDGYENSYNPMVAPEISEAPPDIEEKTWEFYSFRPNFNQYDASMDPIIRSFSKNLGLPEEERADEINQTLELQVSGVPDPDTNPCIEGKPSRIEDDSSNLSSPVRTSLDQPVPTPEGLNKDHKMGSTSVSDLIIRFLEQQDRLFHAEIPFLTSGSPVQLSDELQRFRLWTTEIGILRAGYISLESRLEDSPDIKEQIIWHLSKLEEAMSVIVSQPIPEPDHISSRGAKENDDSSRLAVFSTYKLVQATIDALFQLSLYLDQKSEIGPFEPSDRQHVKEKYPHASKEITNRLGLANAQRRFQMWRLKRRNIMLDRGLEQISISWGDDASSHSSRTVKSTPEEATNMTRDDLEWHVPPPPIPIALSDSSKETILECPYCFSMTAIRTVKDWARHIFNDLMPYVCVYPKCPVPQQMFQSRRQWFLHMATEHLIKENPDLPRKCPLCLSSLWSEIFEKHVGRHLEELALFALPVIEKEDDYGASSTSSDVGMTPPVLFTAHDDHDVGEDEDSQDLHSSGLIQRCPVCHDLLIDMKAHILAHQIGGLEKCPVSNCKYHVTGFVHGHDRDRHILTHYTGDSFYCDFCFQSGTSDTTRFPRVGTFKNHLISVHGVAGDEPFDSYINQANDSPGRCCICNISYSNPHSLYDHLEECVRLKVLRDILPEDLDLSPVLEWEDNGSQSEAHENATASLRSPLDAEATDPRAEGYLSSDPNLQHIEDGGVFEQVSDLSRHRRGNLGALPSQTDANTSFKPDSPVNPLFTTLGREIITSKHRLLKHRPGEDDHDVIFIIHKLRKDPQYIGNLHALFFDSSSIEDGIVTIGMLRRAAAMKLRTTSEDAICMSHNGKPLSYDLMSCREAGLEHNSEVLCKVTNEGPSMQCQISDPETISWLDRLQTQDEVEQDVAKAKRDAAVDYEHGSAPFPAQQSIPEIPDLSSIPSPMEKVTAYKSYFQQELVPICLEYVDRPTTAREPRFYDTRLMRVLHNVLQLLKILNEMNHKRDMQSILACQTLKSQVKRASEQLIEARGT